MTKQAEASVSFRPVIRKRYVCHMFTVEALQKVFDRRPGKNRTIFLSAVSKVLANREIISAPIKRMERPRYLCLANCYAGRFYLLYESELSLTFGTHLVAGKRSDRGSALRLANTERFL